MFYEEMETVFIPLSHMFMLFRFSDGRIQLDRVIFFEEDMDFAGVFSRKTHLALKEGPGMYPVRSRDRHIIVSHDPQRGRGEGEYFSAYPIHIGYMDAGMVEKIHGSCFKKGKAVEGWGRFLSMTVYLLRIDSYEFFRDDVSRDDAYAALRASEKLRKVADQLFVGAAAVRDSRQTDADRPVLECVYILGFWPPWEDFDAEMEGFRYFLFDKIEKIHILREKK